jgi:hypothetical protein
LPGIDASIPASASTACVVWVRRTDLKTELGIAVDEPIAVKQYLGGSASTLHGAAFQCRMPSIVTERIA